MSEIVFPITKTPEVDFFLMEVLLYTNCFRYLGGINRSKKVRVSIESEGGVKFSVNLPPNVILSVSKNAYAWSCGFLYKLNDSDTGVLIRVDLPAVYSMPEDGVDVYPLSYVEFELDQNLTDGERAMWLARREKSIRETVYLIRAGLLAYRDRYSK